MRGARWLALALLGCSHRSPPAAVTPAPAQAPAAAGRSCDYELSFETEPEVVVHGRVTCRGLGPTRFEPAEAELHVQATGPSSARYTLRLDALARRSRSADGALRIGRALVSPISTYLPRPLPQRAGVPVQLRVHTPPGTSFETGLIRSGEGYALMSHEIAVATYSVFGDFERASFELPLFARPAQHAELVAALLGGPLRAPPRAVRGWVERAARATSAFWGGLPAPRVLLVVVPVPGRSGVRFGKLLPESGPAIVLYVGQLTPAAALERDWILVHELFHLGVPSFVGEGKWFDEGLATYFEPIVRHRAGLLGRRELWQGLADGLALGASALARSGLDGLTEYRELYWGGAVVCWLADVEARRASAGRVGLEHGLRRVLAQGGSASEVWDLAAVFDTIDRSLGAPLLRGLAARHAAAHAVPIDELLRDLGVIRGPDGRVTLSDAGPLAGVRRAIERGSVP